MASTNGFSMIYHNGLGSLVFLVHLGQSLLAERLQELCRKGKEGILHMRGIFGAGFEELHPVKLCELLAKMEIYLNCAMTNSAAKCLAF